MSLLELLIAAKNAMQSVLISLVKKVALLNIINLESCKLDIIDGFILISS